MAHVELEGLHPKRSFSKGPRPVYSLPKGLKKYNPGPSVSAARSLELCIQLLNEKVDTLHIRAGKDSQLLRSSLITQHLLIRNCLLTPTFVARLSKRSSGAQTRVLDA